MTHRVLKADTPISREQLDALAEDGWELITIIPWEGGFPFYFRAL
jgi:hypothetical protein